jgi:three-Cys-motif partner protein
MTTRRIGGDLMSEDFFDEQTEASHVKTTIVEKYFKAWATIIALKAKNEKICYIDLYSGPGIYNDGSKSTPLRILEHAIATDNLRGKLVTILNDSNPDFSKQLQENINALGGVETLKHQPVVNNYTIDTTVAQELEKMNMIPSLSFVDPWGYKGLSTTLLNALTASWGSDVLFFFNYNRINTAITNPKVNHLINGIFGEKRANRMRNTVCTLLSAAEREEYVMSQLSEALTQGHTKYVLPFRFIFETKRATSHYLIFISKSPIGYKIMKEIMWRASTEKINGVANYTYLPTLPRYASLFPDSVTLEDLQMDLLRKYASKRMAVKEIYEAHNVGTPFVLYNYKEALKQLESVDKIKVIPPAHSRRNNTMADTVKIVFPSI